MVSFITPPPPDKVSPLRTNCYDQFSNLEMFLIRPHEKDVDCFVDLKHTDNLGFWGKGSRENMQVPD